MVGMTTAQADHGTDPCKREDRLGERACIEGDLRPTMASHGAPAQVFGYRTKAIRDMRPGFDLSSSRTFPDFAKVENVKRMVRAATGE
jgi:hypothetical protein